MQLPGFVVGGVGAPQEAEGRAKKSAREAAKKEKNAVKRRGRLLKVAERAD